MIKQADVLMLHHLLPGWLPRGSLARDLDRYLPRTAHGSSLSPGIHASVLARAGRPDEALDLLRTAAEIDLRDLTGTAAGGVHLATAGSVWQALAYGFLGLWPGPHGTVHLDPQLPAAWRSLTVRVVSHGRPLTIRATHDRVTVRCREPIQVRLDGRVRTVVPPLTDLRPQRRVRTAPSPQPSRR
jgi:trehalose/maltose hydrolase-like predicted phosphorylase